jgi:hypothetical protein
MIAGHLRANNILDYFTAAALAGASRALKGFDDSLSEQSLFYAKQLWNEDDSISKLDTSGFSKSFGSI